ncbi:MAG: ABC transporter ATP-binding protein [Clostridia bacterium]|nr:ABC transporter ATP-binding protein [Clostridia bacterium]
MGKDNKIDWHRTWQNNKYMLRLIYRACPGILIMTLFSNVLGAINSFLIGNYLYKYALNALQEGQELQRILLNVGLMFGFSVLYMIFCAFRNRYMELHRPLVSAYIQKLLQKKAAEVELACFERPDFYDTYVKAVGETADRAFTVLSNFSNMVYLVVENVALGALIVSIHPSFLFLAALPLVYTLLIAKRKNRLGYEYRTRNRAAGRKKDYVRRIFYLKDYSKEMRLTDLWRVMFRQMHESIVDLKALVKKYGFTMMWFAYFLDVLSEIVVYIGAILLAAFKTLVQKSMLLGDCFVIINSISTISRCINQSGTVFMHLDANSLYIENLRTFLDYEVQIAEDETAPAAPKMQTLQLRNVSFSYEGQQTAALQDVNLTIHAGEKIAIVGHNGAGKSTLIKLLLRLYDPSEGDILLNGENIKQYRLSSYRDLYGTVFQDYHLFATSIAENVMLRGPLTKEDEAMVEYALEQSGISEKVHRFSHGIETTVTKEFDPDGAVFSGGEAQKISIARVFAGGQEIVILDEPTSALDPIAEQEMYRNMFAACEGKTVIFISHRLSSATVADRIYLFENGKIKEQGTHTELLAQNGVYTDMWHKQADTYTEDDKSEAVKV